MECPDTRGRGAGWAASRCLESTLNQETAGAELLRAREAASSVRFSLSITTLLVAHPLLQSPDSG